MLVAGLVGLVVGAGAVGGAWALTGGSGRGTGAAADAADACRIFGGLGPMSARPDLATFRRAGAATELAQAAADADPKYKTLGDLGRSVAKSVETLDITRANSEIAKTKEECGRL